MSDNSQRYGREAHQREIARLARQLAHTAPDRLVTIARLRARIESEKQALEH